VSLDEAAKSNSTVQVTQVDSRLLQQNFHKFFGPKPAVVIE